MNTSVSSKRLSSRRSSTWIAAIALSGLLAVAASCQAQPKKIFFGRKDGLAELKVGDKLEITLVGKLEKRPHPNKKDMSIWDLKSFFGKRFSARLNDFGEIDRGPYLDADVRIVAAGEVVRGSGGPEPVVRKVLGVERLSAEEAKAFQEEAAGAEEARRNRVRPFDPSPNALPYSGKWGIRMPLPGACWEDQLKAFDVKAFADQFNQLTTAHHVMINVTHPSAGCYFTGPHPELAKIVGPGYFPTRDLLGEVLTAIKASGRKALVYYAVGGFGLGTRRGEEESKLAWDKHIRSRGLYQVEGDREFVLKYFAETYGEKIDGWWFDGAKNITEQERRNWKKTIRAGNPKAILSFNSMGGPPYRSQLECDYFGGHPTPRSKHKFWEPINLPMITDIEKSPWMSISGAPVKEPGYGALGHVFMGLQGRWTGGTCEFPPDQAVEWTTRVLKAGGMYTWAVPRQKKGNISVMPEAQLQLLLKINAAVEKMRQGEESNALK